MYSRSFYNERDDLLSPPENYDGNAFADRKEAEEHREVSQEKEGEKEDAKSGRNPFSSLFSSPVFSGFFGSKGGGALSSFSMPKIGTEELLIIAAAAYLFFSKQGDKECALLLILLIFVN